MWDYRISLHVLNVTSKYVNIGALLIDKRAIRFASFRDNNFMGDTFRTKKYLDCGELLLNL